MYDDSIEHDPRTFRPPERPLHSFQQQKPVSQARDKPVAGATRILVAPLASGSKLVASEIFRDKLTVHKRKVCGLEMEAEGVAQTARHFDRQFFVIKGISDFAELKTKCRCKTSEEEKWQSYAARASVDAFAQFLRHCQSQGIFAPATSGDTKLPRVPRSRHRLSKEEDFLRMARRPSNKFGKLDLNCKLFPPALWQVQDRREYLYFDDPEQRQQIVLEWVDADLPADTLECLVLELQRAIDDFKAAELFSITELENFQEAKRRLIFLGPSRYGIALIEERQFPLNTAVQLPSTHILNSLTVRVAVIYAINGDRWIEFHQRKGRANATYKDAWDVGAAGYVDPQRHIDTEDGGRISPWRASAHEIEEELNIKQWDLQYREHYTYFGVGRHDPTGQLDILGVCRLARAPDQPRVTRYDRCLLTPESVAAFVLEKEYWVPTTLLTLILVS